MENINLNKIKWFKDKYGNSTAYYQLKIPGVTTIISELIEDPDLDKFIADVGEEKAKQIMEDAAHKGTSAHTFIENFLSELSKSKDPSKALKYTEQTSVKFLNEERIPIDKIDKGRDMFFNFYHSEYSSKFLDLLGLELSIHSPILFYRGKIDVLYKLNPEGIIVTDFKTSSKIIDVDSIKMLKYKRQLGAYALALEHLFQEKNLKVNKSSILNIVKTDYIQEISCSGDELEEQKKEFENLVKTWHINNNQEYLIKK